MNERPLAGENMIVDGSKVAAGGMRIQVVNIMENGQKKILAGKVELPDGSDWKIVNDDYRKDRGGKSEMLAIRCADCDQGVMIYQKDGPGPLKRCYLDRIAWVAGDDSGGENSRELWKSKPLECPHCRAQIGLPMVYKEEKRLAIRMVRGTFRKKIYAK